MLFSFVPSPSPDAILSRYDASRFPIFQCIFEPAEAKPMMEHLVRNPREAELALVFENKSEKDVTALRYRWQVTKLGEKLRPSLCSSDSYLVDAYHPVLAAGDRKLIGPSTVVDQSLLQHLQRGGGAMGSGFWGSRSYFENAEKIVFSIDLILFADGEIAGPDPDNYAADLRLRKPAAEFVARQIRLADTEGRDPAPVLRALAEIPRDKNDVIVGLVHRYAREYLTRTHLPSHHIDWKAATLRDFEKRPELPKFYRRPEIP